SVSVTPNPASVATGQTQQFTATVQATGGLSTAVTWAVNDVPGGNATVGTISPTGLYTAPSTVPSPNPVTVKAVSVADPTKSGTAQVTVFPPIGMVADSSTFFVTVFNADTDIVLGSVGIPVGIPSEVSVGDCSITADQPRGFVTNFNKQLW